MSMYFQFFEKYDDSVSNVEHFDLVIIILYCSCCYSMLLMTFSETIWRTTSFKNIKWKLIPNEYLSVEVMVKGVILLKPHGFK